MNFSFQKWAGIFFFFFTNMQIKTVPIPWYRARTCSLRTECVVCPAGAQLCPGRRSAGRLWEAQRPGPCVAHPRAADREGVTHLHRASTARAASSRHGLASSPPHAQPGRWNPGRSGPTATAASGLARAAAPPLDWQVSTPVLPLLPRRPPQEPPPPSPEPVALLPCLPLAGVRSPGLLGKVRAPAVRDRKLPPR